MRPRSRRPRRASCARTSAQVEGAAHIVGPELFVSGDVGDRPRHAEQAVVSAQGQRAAAQGGVKRTQDFGRRGGPAAQPRARHIGVAPPGRLGPPSSGLRTGGGNDLARAFRGHRPGTALVPGGGHALQPQVDVDPIEKRAREAPRVSTYRLRSALAGSTRDAVLAARAGVRGHHELKPRGVRCRDPGAVHLNHAVLEGLTKGVENGCRELAALVEDHLATEQIAPVGRPL